MSELIRSMGLNAVKECSAVAVIPRVSIFNTSLLVIFSLLCFFPFLPESLQDKCKPKDLFLLLNFWSTVTVSGKKHGGSNAASMFNS